MLETTRLAVNNVQKHMQPEAGETVIVTSLRLLFEILGQLPEILCQMLVTRCYKYSIIMAERKKERKKKDKRVRSFPPSPPPIWHRWKCNRIRRLSEISPKQQQQQQQQQLRRQQTFPVVTWLNSRWIDFSASGDGNWNCVQGCRPILRPALHDATS